MARRICDKDMRGEGEGGKGRSNPVQGNGKVDAIMMMRKRR